LRYRILGPLEIGDGGAPRRISSAKQRALLAVLLLHANEVVPADRLIDELWGESPPETAAKSLQIYVSRLRKAFRASGSGGRGLGSDALVTRPGGYMIRVEPDELDLERFEALLGEGDTALREGDSRRAARALTDALAIWRGPALADVELGSVEREQIGRLEELRMRSQEQLIDANLALGRHAEVVAELETLVGNHPLRERLRGQLMVALYRCGRQADALEVYRETRRKMVDELGIEPGAELRNLEQRILRQDPTLGAPAVSAPSRPESQRASRARSPRQPIALAAAALVALAIAATLIAILAAGGSGGETAEPNSVAVIDPADNKVVDGIPVGSEPSDVSADAGSLWVANAGDNTVSRIDQAARRVTATVAPGTAVNGMTAGEGAVWTSDVRRGVVSRIDPALRRVDRSISVSPGRYFDQLASPIIASTGSVWLGATFDEGRLSRIDASHGTIQARIPLDRGPDGMTAGEGAIWLTSGDTVERVDPTVNGVVAKIPVGRGASAIAAGDGGVWVADTLDNAVVHIDPGTNSVTSTIPVGTAPTGVAVGGGSVWVANSGDGTVSRVDPRTGRVSATVDVGESPRSLTFSDGSVWVSVGSAGASAEGAGSEGQVARVALGDQVDLPTDPALAVPSEVTYATSALLLDYPDSPSPAGSHLHPEVAEGMPAVSDGGRTYTYRIKEGFRFSPPSDQPVTADAFRRAIERVLSPSMQSFGGAVIQDIAGLQAYQDGRARHISGVTARGNTLTIRLTAPSPSLPARLATPYFSAVPPDTPIDPAGIPGIPSAGPYYIATADPNGGRVLKRNPNYGGNRPARTSVIDVLPAQSQARGIADVEEGKTDVVAISPEESGSARVRSQYGRPAAAAQGDSPRFLSGPFPGIEYLAFNTRRPLFSSVRMRRAVNYALDRPALASQALPGGPGRPTDQYIPPAVPGFADASIYPLDGPDLSQARRLARGAGGGKAVMYTCEDPWCSHNAAVVSSNLRAIGIELEVKTFPQEPISRLFRANEPWDIAEATWIADNADPFDSLNVPFGLLDKPNGINFGRFDDPAFERRLGTAATLSGPARYSTYGQLDADLAREQAPAAAYASNTRDYLFAAHVGCEVIQPIYGVDLGALCS
jgi:YVTN family beta-propeller protein